MPGDQEISGDAAVKLNFIQNTLKLNTAPLNIIYKSCKYFKECSRYMVRCM